MTRNLLNNIYKTNLILVLLFVSLLAFADKKPPVIDYKSISHPVIGSKGMVVSQREIASRVGADILLKGGNAIDAAVATSFALSVVLPRAGNLGGGGFMLVYLKKEDKTIAIDYRERAPLKATRDMFLDSNGNYDKNKARFSLLSAGVPGTVAGMKFALENYGTMTWSEVIQPAIDLAEGFLVPHDLSSVTNSYKKRLQRNQATKEAYYKESGEAYLPGEVMKLTDLAWSLKKIRDEGPYAFYEGDIAKKIVSEMERGGGWISMEDLSTYKVSLREPVVGTFKGYKIVSMPPSSSGGVHIIQMLNMLEETSIKEMGFGSSDSIHLLSEVMKRAYADRSKFLGDMDFVEVPVNALTSKDYAKQLLKDVSQDLATPSKKILPGNPSPYESPDTTHFSVMDSEGNTVSNTYTLNFSFGSGITIPGTGILLNNEMDDFSSKPGVPNAFGLLGAEANSIEPQKRPLSSMTPTIIFKGNDPYLVLGSPGGSRIISTVLQVIVNVLVHEMNIAEAVNSPRIHHQWYPDTLYVEKGYSPDTLKLLEKKGHSLSSSGTMGSVHAIIKEEDYFYGAADTRRPNSGAIPVD